MVSTQAGSESHASIRNPACTGDIADGQPAFSPLTPLTGEGWRWSKRLLQMFVQEGLFCDRLILRSHCCYHCGLIPHTGDSENRSTNDLGKLFERTVEAAGIVRKY